VGRPHDPVPHAASNDPGENDEAKPTAGFFCATAHGARRSRSGAILGIAAAAMAATAVFNIYQARRVERRNPPRGRFVDVDGVRLHYLERGEGPPVVLLHGNVVTAEDFAYSGISTSRPNVIGSSRSTGRIWATATVRTADNGRRQRRPTFSDCPSTAWVWRLPSSSATRWRCGSGTGTEHAARDHGGP
jgi:hypothetical protein